MSVSNFLKNLKRLWYYSLEENYQTAYEFSADLHQGQICHSQRITKLEAALNRHIIAYESSTDLHKGQIHHNQLLIKIDSELTKQKTITAYLVKDIEDLKNAQHKAESASAGNRGTETTVAISINVDGVPVHIKE